MIRHLERKLNVAITKHLRRAVAAARADKPGLRESYRDRALHLMQLRDMLTSGSETRQRQAVRCIRQMVAL